MALLIVNTFPAGSVTPPVVERSGEDQTPVTVWVEWNDGRKAKTTGVVLSLSPQATLVELTGPDGRRRREWFASHVVVPQRSARHAY
jgi:hypothetical protein